MKEPKWDSCSEKELWEYVAFHLSLAGINTVLVGGAVVSIYTKGIFVSGDLDLVLQNYQVDENTFQKVLQNIGFEKYSTRNYYKHPKCDDIFIEFMSPPVSIGEDYNIKPDEIKIDGTVIKILSPTDCIKDRLASYIYFNARECFEQAILVAKEQLFDIKSVEKWCRKEGGSAIKVFNEFKNSLK